MSDLPKIAASHYSNTAPLIWSFWHGERRNEVKLLTDAAPAKCAEMLSANLVDFALTPVIEYQRIDNTLIIPEVCIASNFQVKSVCLVTKDIDLREAKTIALDISSKTSVALTQIIFREFFDKSVEFTAKKPDISMMLENADCALLIGDPALNVDRNKFRVFDIVEIWREFTGFGFVFAFWLMRNSSDSTKIDFANVRDEGLEKQAEIIDFYSNEVSLNREDFKKYLSENICYSLTDDLLKGLQLFYELAHKLDLIKANKPLIFR